MIEYFIFKLGCSNGEKSVKMRSKEQAYTHVVKSTWNYNLRQDKREIKTTPPPISMMEKNGALWLDREFIIDSAGGGMVLFLILFCPRL